MNGRFSIPSRVVLFNIMSTAVLGFIELPARGSGARGVVSIQEL
jgi:hypothetical protein